MVIDSGRWNSVKSSSEALPFPPNRQYSRLNELNVHTGLCVCLFSAALNRLKARAQLELGTEFQFDMQQWRMAPDRWKTSSLSCKDAHALYVTEFRLRQSYIK